MLSIAMLRLLKEKLAPDCGHEHTKVTFSYGLMLKLTQWGCLCIRIVAEAVLRQTPVLSW